MKTDENRRLSASKPQKSRWHYLNVAVMISDALLIGGEERVREK